MMADIDISTATGRLAVRCMTVSRQTYQASQLANPHPHGHHDDDSIKLERPTHAGDSGRSRPGPVSSILTPLRIWTGPGDCGARSSFCGVYFYVEEGGDLWV
jgi:hypothetical protein